MAMDLLNVLAGVVCFLVLIVTFKQVDLHIRINNLLDVHVKANKENTQVDKKDETSLAQNSAVDTLTK